MAVPIQTRASTCIDIAQHLVDDVEAEILGDGVLLEIRGVDIEVEVRCQCDFAWSPHPRSGLLQGFLPPLRGAITDRR